MKNCLYQHNLEIYLLCLVAIMLLHGFEPNLVENLYLKAAASKADAAALALPKKDLLSMLQYNLKL